MASAGKLDLVIEQYATWTKVLRYQDAAGVPFSFVDHGARLQVRSTVDGDPPLLDMSTTDGRIVLHPTNGTITLHLTDEETGALNWRNARPWDLVLDLPDESVQRLVGGTCRITPGVTRPEVTP